MSEIIQQCTGSKSKHTTFFAPNSTLSQTENIAVVLSRCVIGAAVLRFYQKLIKRWFPLQSWQLYNDEAAI